MELRKIIDEVILNNKDEWTCESCDEIHDRDINAAKNILKQGINILSGLGTESYIKQKQGEALPLGKSATFEANPSPLAWVGSSRMCKTPIKIIDIYRNIFYICPV